MTATCPRIIIAGSAGDAGKTLVSLGLLAALRRRGLHAAVFKKGPDFIDAAWLGRAAGGTCRNLDTFLMPETEVVRSFARHTTSADIAVIEGNRGLHDGRDAQGTHSTAALAALLNSPVVLVHPVRKVTRTAAAAILGLCRFDRNISVVGVVLNGVAGERHERVITEALASAGGPPVFGAIPQLDDETFLPGRHLGLVTPEEHQNPDALIDRAADIVAKYVNVDRILDAASGINPPQGVGHQTLYAGAPQLAVGGLVNDSVRLGYFRDSAFTFYYPENLEALAEVGAELAPISALVDRSLPANLDGLYIGGGFPETHAAKLAENKTLREAVRRAAAQGMPIYAECGGLVYLAQTLVVDGIPYPMAGVFPVVVVLERKPQGHGYSELMVDRENPFFRVGAEIRGHEFHYTRILGGCEQVETACAVDCGTGCFGKRDGLAVGRTLATYTHIHALGTPGWAAEFVRAARAYRAECATAVPVGCAVSESHATPGDFLSTP